MDTERVAVVVKSGSLAGLYRLYDAAVHAVGTLIAHCTLGATGVTTLIRQFPWLAT